MAFIHFYNGRTRQYVGSYFQEVNEPSITIGLNGSITGQIMLEVTADNRSFLQSLCENSHWVKFGLDKVYGGVIENSIIEGSVCTVDVIGSFEYLDKVDAVASHKAAVESGVAPEDDHSWVKVFYGDSPVGVLHEVMRNLQSSMAARGFDGNLFDYSNLRFHTVDSGGVEWERSYRVNSLEVPSVKTVIEDVLQDDGMQLFRIRVSSSVTDPFQFIMEVVTSADVHNVDEATGHVFDIKRSGGDVKRRSFSIAKGTDLEDRSRVERVSFDGGVAYSSLMTAVPKERSGAIRRTAEASALAEGSRHGIVSLTSEHDVYDPLDFIMLDASAGGLVTQGIITEKVIDGRKITYTVQEGDAPSFNGALVKPAGIERKIIFNPLRTAGMVAGVAANRMENSTGWMS